MEASRSHPSLHELLESALLLVREVEDPALDRSELAQLVASSLHQLYRANAAAAHPAAFADAIVLASLEIDRALELVPERAGYAGVVELRDHLTATAEELRRAAAGEMEARLPSKEQPWGGARASVDVPVLLDPPRDVVVPSIPLPRVVLNPAVERSVVPEPPRIASVSELDALLQNPPQPTTKERVTRKRAAEAPRVAPFTAAQHIEALASLLVEELGMLGLVRQPREGQGWSGKARTEKRLLARVDAIVSCGAQVLPSLVRLLERRPVPDAELTWGLLFLFGSVAGDDMIDEALRLARASALSVSEVRDAVADAFALIPNVRIEARLRPWLRSSDANERAIAVHALGRRGALSADELPAVLEDELVVAREAAFAIGSVAGRLDERALETVLHHGDEIVARRALFAAVSRHHAAGLRRARRLVAGQQGTFADAALVFAVSEGREGLDLLLEDAAVSGAPAVLVALGWFGHMGAIPYLLGRLESEDDVTVAAAANALARMAGHVLDDELPRPTPEPPREDRRDAKPWRTWWRKHDRRADARVRVRFGAPWRPQTNVLELEQEHASAAHRILSHLELVARLGITAPFDPRAFVARQRIQLEGIAERANLAAAGASGWPVHMPL
jgi:hypothetical protein